MSLNRACYFLTQNFAESSQVNGMTISSEVFPLVATNLFDQYKRSKKWRSAGYFKLDDSSKKIVIKEGAGAPFTITLSVFEFSSRSAFLSHVQSAINDSVSSALTYTLSIDATTKKTKISATGSFTVVTTDPLSAGLCAALGFSTIADLTGANQYLADTIVIHTQEHFIFDLGVDAKVEAFVLIGERAKSINLTSFAEVRIEANHTADWSSPLYSEIVPYGPKAVSIARNGGLSVDGFRFWRVVIKDPGNTDGYIEFTKLYLGDAYSPERGAAQFPFQGDIDEKSTIDENEYGERFSIERRKTEKFSIDWDACTFKEKEQIVDIFESKGRAKPIFMIYDGNGVFSSGSQYYSRFVYFDGPPRYRLTSPGVFSVTTSFSEVP